MSKNDKHNEDTSEFLLLTIPYRFLIRPLLLSPDKYIFLCCICPPASMNCSSPCYSYHL